MEWLKGQELLAGVKFANVDRVGTSVEAAWSNIYIQDSYKRGVIRARYELNKAGFNVPPMEATGGIAASLNAPIHADRVGLLFTRVYSEMNGITDAMDQQISRVLAQGIIDGDNPRLLARKLNAVIDGYKLGDLGITDSLGRFIPAKRRAETLARTEIIRAHAEAQLVEYGNWIDEVRIKAEWATAGDNRVCERCASREGQVLTIEQAQGLIPLHPNCRCIWLPFNQELVARRSNR
jgi:SPP1 gp7 family putative phage head morphogenesis protein